MKLKKQAPNDALLVIGSPCALLCILTRIIWVRSNIVYDAGWPLIDGIVSRENTRIKKLIDYFKLYLIDFFAFKLANLIAFESISQIKFSRKLFLISKNKVFVSYTGFNETLFSDIDENYLNRESKSLQLIFRGKYNIESGLDTLAKVTWFLNTNVQALVVSPNIPNSIEFAPRTTIINKRITEAELISYYKNSMLSIGQLGDNRRISRTIPHKFFESVYFNVPYFTQFTCALEELITKSDCFVYSKVTSPNDLAKHIEFILDDANIQRSVATSAKNKYVQKFSQNIIAQRFFETIMKI